MNQRETTKQFKLDFQIKSDHGGNRNTSNMEWLHSSYIQVTIIGEQRIESRDAKREVEHGGVLSTIDEWRVTKNEKYPRKVSPHDTKRHL